MASAATWGKLGKPTYSRDYHQPGMTSDQSLTAATAESDRARYSESLYCTNAAAGAARVAT
eukprot:CAMPEP_0195588516 /NCGR_PEP_ID=MMETSP0814-20130614/32803_1 /TAXON_ID=97485 /ORGANISM="Prymnesium parvum, Strain Texoma1" /LENGTH=60 /DNA_ID=CAMNT_0040727477 /DNA_START=103 /DNA_END=283 /DNA_ORIENTATION=+